MSWSNLSPARECFSRALPAVGRDPAVGRSRSRPLPHRSSAARVRRWHGAGRVDAAAGSDRSQYTTVTQPAPAPPPGAGVDNGAIKDVALFWIIGGVAYYLKMQEGKKKKAEATAAAVASALEAKAAEDGDAAKTDDARDQPTEEEKKQ